MENDTGTAGRLPDIHIFCSLGVDSGITIPTVPSIALRGKNKYTT